MLGVSGLLGNSGGGATDGSHEDEVGVAGAIAGGFGEEDKGKAEEGERNSAGSRWPRQETLALLKIRSEMGVAFRDSTLKGPLWEEVSRKLAELGYHRSAKKCKEKFENVYKYHKRTKGGRASKHDGKTYRFFEQLEALDNHPLPPLSPHKVMQTPTATVPPTTATMTATTMATANPPGVVVQHNVPASVQNLSANTEFVSTSATTSSSTDSDEESEGTRKKKMKLMTFFERLMKEMIEKQETLQKRFLEAIEKRERERMEREEAWKVQEMARMNRELEMLVQERSIAAAKDAAVIAFLQKISEQSSAVQLMEVQLPEKQAPPEKAVDPPRAESTDNVNANAVVTFSPVSSSRWPKAEVQALINLRTTLDLKYQENGPKGPLWEEISSAMKKLGYNRSAKRCKEKWENINKYFKKVKESNKKRPEDSKTCPYFHQLDALYREKTKKVDNSFINPSYELKPEDLMRQMMSRPEQVMPLRQEPPRPDSVMDDIGSENMDQNQDEDCDDDDDEEDEDEASAYGIVTNTTNPSSMAMVE
ncbi:PREDICTED: trihelix transcription factor GT-2-like [Nelumbo nucifera]|uniref:Trihelix transcription factor GT-2-like n=1 Tax=Nelumbo nucifera TaxID=4432 RepID=A0A1U7YV28_NELNU|nr:PREDICTED: trihelix transcription factor GT-2-like [Nelumbo nucifera]